MYWELFVGVCMPWTLELDCLHNWPIGGRSYHHWKRKFEWPVTGGILKNGGMTHMPCFIGQIWSRCSVLLAGRKDVLQYYASLILTCMIAYDPCQSHAFATKLWAENEATLFEQPHWQMRTVELLKIARGTAECVRYGTTEFKSAISVGSIPAVGCLSPMILAFVSIQMNYPV